MPKQQPVMEVEQVVFGGDEFQTLIAAILSDLMNYQPPPSRVNKSMSKQEPGDQ